MPNSGFNIVSMRSVREQKMGSGFVARRMVFKHA